MKRTIGLILLALTGCANLPTPPPLNVSPDTAELGLLLMMNSGYTSAPQTFGEILGKSVLQEQGAMPITPPLVQPLAAPPPQVTCIQYPPNQITGQSRIVCQ